MNTKKPSHFVAFNEKKNIYSIFEMGPLRVNAKTALCPDSDGEYALAQVKFKGTENQCEAWAKFTYKDTESEYAPTDNELAIKNDEATSEKIKIKNSNQSECMREEMEKIRTAKLKSTQQSPLLNISNKRKSVSDKSPIINLEKTSLTPFISKRSSNLSSTPKHDLSSNLDTSDDENLEHHQSKAKKSKGSSFKCSEALAKRIANSHSDSSFSELNLHKKAVPKKLFENNEKLLDNENESQKENEQHVSIMNVDHSLNDNHPNNVNVNESDNLPNNVNDATGGDTSIEYVQTAKLLASLADQIFKQSQLIGHLMNKFDTLESTNNHLETVVKKLESAVNNSNKPCKSNDDTRRVMYEGKNLLSIHATAPNKWVNSVMRHLFTKDELGDGLIIDDLKSKSKRTPLNLEKVDLLKEALFIKYNVSETKQEAFWLQYKRVANTFCRDHKPSNNTEDDSHISDEDEA